MNWSLNEIEALAKKATRGAGLSWGLAEEAGKSARWLSAMGLPGADCLAAVLTQNDRVAYDTICPEGFAGVWTARGGTLCPLTAGACLCDHATALAEGLTITLGRTAFPLLLFPYVAAASDMTGAPLGLAWDGVDMTRNGGLSFIASASGATDMPVAASVQVRRVPAPDGDPVRRAWRGDISSATMATLGRFAHRTYAPDTPESRMAGAGAGLTDND